MTNAERLQAAVTRIIEDAAEREHCCRSRWFENHGIYRDIIWRPMKCAPVDTLARIAEACGVTIADIFKEAGL